MKKKICAVAIALTAVVPTMASAAPTVFEDVKYALMRGGVAPTGFTGAECALLSANVKLAVSKSVVGGFACNETTNLVQVAACHQGGSRDQGVACNGDGDPNTDGVQLPAGCSSTAGNSTIPSFKAFSLVSSGGNMTEVALGTRCTTASLPGITWIQ